MTVQRTRRDHRSIAYAHLSIWQTINTLVKITHTYFMLCAFVATFMSYFNICRTYKQVTTMWKHLFPSHWYSAQSTQMDTTGWLLVFSPAVWIQSIGTQPSSLLPLTWWAETAVCPDESRDPLGWICSDDGAIPRLSTCARPYDWISRHGWGTVCVCISAGVPVGEFVWPESKNFDPHISPAVSSCSSSVLVFKCFFYFSCFPKDRLDLSCGRNRIE